MKFLRFCIVLPLILLRAPSAHAQEITVSKLSTAYELPNVNADIGYWFGDSDDSHPERNAPSQGIDTGESVNFGPYMAKLKSRIRRNWIAPVAKNARGTILEFLVFRDGSVSGLRVVRSSGSFALDQSALDTVSQTSPFDPLPDAYQKDFIKINFTFDLNVFGGEVTYF